MTWFAKIPDTSDIPKLPDLTQADVDELLKEHGIENVLFFSKEGTLQNVAQFRKTLEERASAKEYDKLSRLYPREVIDFMLYLSDGKTPETQKEYATIKRKAEEHVKWRHKLEETRDLVK